MNDATPLPGSKRRWPTVVVIALLSVAAAIAVGEWLGWPFLAAPLQRMLSEKLDRRVRFAVDADQMPTEVKGFQIRFVGGVRLVAPALEVAAPAWSKSPHMLIARDVVLDLRYVDLWRAYRGTPLRIDNLKAAMVDGNLERLADGRSSWQFGPDRTTTPTALSEPMPSPVFGNLQVSNGTLRYRDVPLATEVEVRLSLVDGNSVVTAQAPPKRSDAAVATVKPGNVLKLNATGRYRALPLKLELVSAGVLPWTTDEAHAAPVGLTLNATVGRAELAFKGTATDARHLNGFTGRFSLKGPSLAAAGEPLGVTLPTTPAFRTAGVIVRRTDSWYVVIDDATVGASRLNGAFTYETGRSVPLLSGRLGGSRLLLTDLGPVVGTTAITTTAQTAITPATITTQTTIASVATPPIKTVTTKTNAATNKSKGLVLPNRPFDLASLRAMDANVLFDIDEVDLSTRLLEPLRPLQGHLQLQAGVLSMSNLSARTGEGKLAGGWRLDGRGSKALWNVDLRWDSIKLERWIRQTRANNAPPYVSGRLHGKTAMQGEGRSTAEILATLKGQFRAELREGTISHLVVEMAGLDIAEALGLFLTGDKTLPVQCAVADLVATDGIFRPRVMVLDTTDSTIWIDGSLSLAKEVLDLKAVVTPKDFSPLTLRTPLLVRGTFGNPVVSIEKGPLTRTLATAFLLALVNPLAALIPLIDRGDADEAKVGAAGCQALTQRSYTRRTAAVR